MHSKSNLHLLELLPLIILLLYTLFPLYMAISTSFKNPGELFLNPFGLPTKINVSNYMDVLMNKDFQRAFVNTIILTVGTIIGVLVTAIPMAYALAKITFPGSSLLMSYVFFCTTIPAQLFIVPLYHIFARIGFLNSWLGMILIYVAVLSPFQILLLRSYFITIPQELFEAALVDGASWWKALWQIILPVARPGVTTSIVLVAMNSWHQFLLPLTFLQKSQLQPLTVAVAMFQGKWSVDWGKMVSASLLSVLPIAILFALLHRKFIAGLAATGIKG